MKLSIFYDSILNKNERGTIRKHLIDSFGVSQTTVFNWLSGRSIPPERYWDSIAEIMGVPVAELFPDPPKPRGKNAQKATSQNIVK